MITCKHISNIKNTIFCGNRQNEVKNKHYYEYSIKKIDITSDESGYKLLGISLLGSAIIFAGMIILHKKVVAKQINKVFTKKTPKAITNMAYWGISTATSFMLPIFILEKALTTKKKLKPISEAEQIKKEQQIKNTVSDLSKQKNVIIKGIIFENFSKDNLESSPLAAFDAKTGYLVLHSKFKDTNLSVNELKPIVLHELTHAKQYEIMARSKDGIYKINRALVSSGANSLDEKNKEKLLNAEDSQLAIDIENKTTINKEKQINGLKAIKIYLKNPNISERDLPLLIDENYYKKIIENKPPLNKEEEEKANNYLSYIEKQGKIYSKVKQEEYLKNLMEKEAFNAQYTYIKTGQII
ncbi:MAG: hypothetical protein WCG95_00500 [bacterium]